MSAQVVAAVYAENEDGGVVDGMVLVAGDLPPDAAMEVIARQGAAGEEPGLDFYVPLRERVKWLGFKQHLTDEEVEAYQLGEWTAILR